MTEALFGFVGVLIGTAIPWIQAALSARGTRDRDARYLAVRVVCTLDTYVENCAAVVADDGMSYGQPNKDGCLEAQVVVPKPPQFPDALEWKSIEHGLMYRLLTLPNEAEAMDRMLDGVADYADPPYDSFFEERQYQYAKLGLAASGLADELRKTYGITPRNFATWNPVQYLAESKVKIEQVRAERSKNLPVFPLEASPTT